MYTKPWIFIVYCVCYVDTEDNLYYVAVLVVMYLALLKITPVYAYMHIYCYVWISLWIFMLVSIWESICVHAYIYNGSEL